MTHPIGRRLGVLLFVSLTAARVGAQTRIENLEAYFAAWSQNRQFNGNVLVAENGKIAYERSFGYADFSGKKPATRDTLFPLASISKTLTATAILQLYEKGKLRPADPVVKHLPAFPYPEITIRHLLSHSSGLPPYNAFFDSAKEADPKKVFTNADFLPGLVAGKKPLVYPPGTNWNYDNVNYIVLAIILESVSGTPFDDYIENRILRPAGMRETVFLPLSRLFDPARKKSERLGIPHWYPHIYSDEPLRADRMPYVSSYWRAYDFQGFSDYAGTTHDLLKFDEALSGGRLLSERVFDEAFTPAGLEGGKEASSLYGLGWAIEKDDSLGKIVYHGGGAVGSSCALLRNITKRQAAVVFDVAHDQARLMAFEALKILNGQRVPAPKKSLARIYGKALIEKGPAAARNILDELRKDPERYALSEEEINSLGYDFLGDSNPFHRPEEHRYAEALEAFKLNVELFPAGWNAYDSYGEALLKTGKTEEAAEMYRKSIELNPHNENGKKALEKIKIAR